MSRRLARRLAALARSGKPRIKVAAIDGYHTDARRFTVRRAEDATNDSTTGETTNGQS